MFIIVTSCPYIHKYVPDPTSFFHHNSVPSLALPLTLFPYLPSLPLYSFYTLIISPSLCFSL